VGASSSSLGSATLRSAVSTRPWALSLLITRCVEGRMEALGAVVAMVGGWVVFCVLRCASRSERPPAIWLGHPPLLICNAGPIHEWVGFALAWSLVLVFLLLVS